LGIFYFVILRIFELVTVKNKCIGIIKRHWQVFFEGMDCVSMPLNCAFEVGILVI